MSYHVFFDFSNGLASPLMVPKGTKESLNEHVCWVEDALRIKRTKYLDNPAHWDHWNFDFTHLEDKEFCEIAEEHNTWVRSLYRQFSEWSKNPVKDGEVMTPEDAAVFWPGLQMIEVSPDRWSAEYYIARMESLYEVMRGRDTDGISFDEKALTPRQAAQVINLFSTFLDPDDRRLDVPRGRDYLASSYDGGYIWCEKCGAMDPTDAYCCPKRKCPIREELE